MYAIIQPDSPTYARVISRHRTIAAADAAWERALRQLHRQPGGQQSYYDWAIIALQSDAVRAPRVNRHTGGI